VPALLQTWLVLPLHCFVPAVQAPVQVPAEHKTGHVWSVCQIPLVSQV